MPLHGATKSRKETLHEPKGRACHSVRAAWGCSDVGAHGVTRPMEPEPTVDIFVHPDCITQVLKRE